MPAEGEKRQVEPAACLEAVERLRGAKVLVIGDVMLDHYVFGRVERISPEAPVPVVLAENEKYILGGAGNVAQNVNSLGGSCRLVCVHGEDAEGAMLEQRIQLAGVDAKTIVDKDRPTTRKTRILAASQQVVRVDTEVQGPVEEKVVERILQAVSSDLHHHSVVILSDYGKGVVNEQLVRGLVELAQAQKSPPRIFVDPKTKNYTIYRGVDLLTPNANEAGEGAGVKVADRKDVLMAGVRLFRRLKPRHLLVTTGPDGMVFFESPDEAWHIPTFAKKVYDVTGAGDTVIASLGLSIAAGCDLKLGCVLANHAAGLAVAQVGSVAVKHEELALAVRHPCPVMTRLL
jgi:rfaE bifunctional protein kinase chain/domain